MDTQFPEMYAPSEDKKIAAGVFKTSVQGVFYIERTIYADDRGFFSEIVKIPELEKAIGSPFIVKQINYAHSKQNVIRGIHAEGWRKYVAVMSGMCFNAVADVRPESPTFMKKDYFVLGFGENALTGCLFLPSGVGNSVLAMNGSLDYLYLVDRLYKDRDPSGDVAISLFDPDLNMHWPIPKEQMIISDRDKNSVTLRERSPDKFK